MNILIPHLWLKDHLETKAKPNEIQKYLSLCGPSVEQIEKVGQEYVYNIEITTNRVDSASVRGIAREASAILPRFNTPAKLKPLKLPASPKATNNLPLKVSLKNSKLCPRFTAVILDHISIKPSPGKIQNKLKLAGLRPINNVVDITNFLMHALGQPVHVFDYDKIQKATMILRESKPGEKLTTLDGKTHTLPGQDIVIEDGTGRLIDLCGIMGGQNSAISEKTSRLVFFVQTYEPMHIRRTSMSLAQRSQAAALFEKGLDPETVTPTLRLGIKMFSQLADAQVASKITDIYPKKTQPKPIRIEKALIDTYLGFNLPPKKIKQILASLEFNVKLKNETFIVTPPTFRAHDIQIPEDLIEEIARIYGYHRLPSQLMTGPLPTDYPEENFALEQIIKHQLAAWGSTEVYTLSLVSRQLASAAAPLSQHLKLKNPLLKELTYLRRSLIPSHLEVIANNQSNEKTIKIFEIANVYLPKKGHLPEEKLELLLTTTQPFLLLKGTVEKLLNSLHLNWQIIPHQENQLLAQKRQALITANDQIIGEIGETKLELLNKFSLTAPISTALFDLGKLLKASQPYPRCQTASKFPPIIQDLTFILPPQTYSGQVTEEILSSDKLVQEVEVKEIFGQSHTYTIKFHHPKKALTSQDVKPVRKKIVTNIKKHFQGKLKGKA